MPKKQLRHQGIDLLRLISVVMVIGIHTSGGYFIDASTLCERWQAMPWYALSVGAVPLFVMMSGAFMLQSSRSISNLDNLYRRDIARKILLPLLFWTIAYHLWFRLKEGSWQPFSWHHLWFLVMLAELYAITPMLRSFCTQIESGSRSRRKGSWGLLILIGASYLLALSLDIYSRSVGVTHGFLLWWAIYLPFYLAGYLIYRSANRHPSRGVWIALLIISLALYGATLISIPMGSSRVSMILLESSLSPLIMLKVIPLFALACRWHPRGRFTSRISSLYPFIMGIYLTHLAILNIVSKSLLILLPGIQDYPIINIPIRVLLVALISLGATILLRKIPVLRAFL